MSHTYAVLAISEAAFDEIKQKLEGAGYSDQFLKNKDGSITIDMHGLALAKEKK